jgi:hypothetical protein
MDATVKRREELTMRRLAPMLASASAAALTTLAVTVAVPAIADDPAGGKGPDAFAACLRAHGLGGAPDGAALKPWLGERMGRGDAATKRALAACSPKERIAMRGPSERELRSCLKNHGVDVPGGDAMELKRWVLEHGDDAASRDAMKACGMAPVAKGGVAGACEKAAPGKPALPAGRADKQAFSLED